MVLFQVDGTIAGNYLGNIGKSKREVCLCAVSTIVWVMSTMPIWRTVKTQNGTVDDINWVSL